MNAVNTALVAKYKGYPAEKGLQRAELETLIKDENQGINAKALKAILDAVFSNPAPGETGSAGSKGGSGKKPPAVKESSPNDELDLSEFNYREMKGEVFEKYAKLVGDRSIKNLDDDGNQIPLLGSLPMDKEFDFVLLKAKPITKPRFAGIPDSPIDCIGIQALDLVPLHVTRTSIRHAVEFNAQIMNAHSRAGHGKYYFLKQ